MLVFFVCECDEFVEQFVGWFWQDVVVVLECGECVYCDYFVYGQCVDCVGVLFGVDYWFGYLVQEIGVCNQVFECCD